MITIKNYLGLVFSIIVLIPISGSIFIRSLFVCYFTAAPLYSVESSSRVVPPSQTRKDRRVRTVIFYRCLPACLPAYTVTHHTRNCKHAKCRLYRSHRLGQSRGLVQNRGPETSHNRRLVFYLGSYRWFYLLIVNFDRRRSIYSVVSTICLSELINKY